jgi:hypothetical protein
MNAFNRPKSRVKIGRPLEKVQNWDRCCDFKNIFANFCQKMAFLTRNKGKLRQFFIIPLAFEKNAIFCLKIVKNRRKS